MYQIFLSIHLLMDISVASIPWASLVLQKVKNLPAHRRLGFNPWVRKILWRREWLPTPVFTPRESHGQRSLDKEGFPQTLRILTQEKKRLLINGKGPKLRIITTSLWNRGKGQTC